MKYLSFIFLVIFLSCESSTEPDPAASKLYISAANTTMAVGEQNTISLKVQNLSESIFAISLKIEFDNTVLEYSNPPVISSGDFFTQSAISFAQQNNAQIHMSVSQIKGQEQVSGSGTICTFNMDAESTGSSILKIVNNEIHFYDSSGEEISVSDLKYEATTINVE